MKIFLIVIMVIYSGISFASEEQLEGMWKDQDEPVWLELTLSDDGMLQGVMKRNDNDPEMVGKVILKDISGKSENSWDGKVWANIFGSYKNAELTLEKSGRLQIEVSVGFLSKTVHWVPANTIGNKE